MTRLQDLYYEQGQSPWLDNLRRGWITGGELARWVERGVRGITSNPTIFQKAISASDEYDDQFGELVDGGQPVDAAYWTMVTDDIEARPAASCGRSTTRATGVDGYVSVEVAPDLARDRDGTVASARELHDRIAEPNLYVKVPATAEGVDAIRTLIGEGRSINVTLIFGLDRYARRDGGLHLGTGGLRRRPVAGRQRGLVLRQPGRHRGRPPARRHRHRGRPGAAGQGRSRPGPARLRNGSSNVSAARAGRRWRTAGARVQRPLWASTSTKNPHYPDTLYVDTLIGPDTVNTMPEATLDAFEDHGTLARTVDADPDAAQRPRWTPSRRWASTSTTSAACSRTRAWPRSPRASTS